LFIGTFKIVTFKNGQMKKLYQTPKTRVFILDTEETILAGSQIGFSDEPATQPQRVSPFNPIEEEEE
jgi:hypothetical protein